MKKQDLKSGHVVEMRGGYFYIFMKSEFGDEDILYNQCDKNHMDIERYKDDLTFPTNKIFDVVAVYEPVKAWHLKNIEERKIDKGEFKLVWERKEEVKYFLADKFINTTPYNYLNYEITEKTFLLSQLQSTKNFKTMFSDDDIKDLNIPIERFKKIIVLEVPED